MSLLHSFVARCFPASFETQKDPIVLIRVANTVPLKQLWFRTNSKHLETCFQGADGSLVASQKYTIKPPDIFANFLAANSVSALVKHVLLPSVTVQFVLAAFLHFTIVRTVD